ncbi:hypothetical protein GCM10027296_06270 [Chitinimonas naiadis]
MAGSVSAVLPIPLDRPTTRPHRDKNNWIPWPKATPAAMADHATPAGPEARSPDDSFVSSFKIISLG